MTTPEYATMSHHFLHPQHQGLLEDWTHHAHGFSKVCRDEGEFTATIRLGVIEEIGWEARGCTFVRAAMSIMAENAHGALVARINQMQDREMYELFGFQAAMRKPDCVAFPLELLKEALNG